MGHSTAKMDSFKSSSPKIFFILFLTLFTATFASQSYMPRLGIVQRSYYQSTEGKKHPPPPPDEHRDFTTFYYEQTLDHFNYRPESYQKFHQRYLMNFKYWGGAAENAPILVYLGAEESIDDDIDSVGFLDDNAHRLRALVVFIEVRNICMCL